MAIKLQPVATKVLEDDGWLCGKTEVYSGFSKQMKDLFGFVDGIGIKCDKLALFQFTGEDYTSHIKKINDIEEVPHAKTILKASPIIMIGVKRMLYKKGGKQKRYYYRCGVFKLDNEGEIEYIELQAWKQRINNLECVYKYLKEKNEKNI